ncbi:MAG: flagellar hook-associated protein FlgK [Ideonella sp.]|jgi:flagellar hook-associated protein 1|nr:flagellar hook-associated protein FlgK [Ideonella sp.]MBL0148791.1 flagellar hook-associated protein FlgK [Ideonella sp.]
MSSSMLMSIGTQAMFAAYAQLNTISNNIANANTVGYSRQRTMQTTVEGQVTGSGYFGRGVTVATVVRASNLFLTQQAESARSMAAADGTQSDMLQQLEKVFGSGDAGLGHAATAVFNAFSDLAAAPADLSARQAVIARCEDLASMCRSDSDQIEALQANVFVDVKNSVAEVNTLAAQVAKLNERIANALGVGHTPNDLMDQRDALIAQIGDKVTVHTIDASDGTISLFVAGGQNLVLGSLAGKLVVRPDEYDSSRAALSISMSGQETPLDTRAIAGGSLAGALTFQNDDLVEARNRLGQLSAALAVAMNKQQSHGIDLQGNVGQPLFDYGTPKALPAATNATAAGAFVASFALAITDGGALQASEYELQADPANPALYNVTRRCDGKVFSGVADGASIDGFSITLNSGPLGPLDRFLLKPVSCAAADMALKVTNPRAVAAGSPVTAVASTANKGTATVGMLAVVADPSGPYQPLTLKFSSATGDYDLLDSTNAVVASGTWDASSPISYNGFALKLKGTPAMGDVFSIAPTAYPAASNGNALAFDQMASTRLIEGETFSDAYAQVLSGMGVRVQSAMNAAETSSAVSASANQALASEVGVNLDEEAAKLIQYQQAYQAAAKMLTTAQTVMDVLLQLGR